MALDGNDAELDLSALAKHGRSSAGFALPFAVLGFMARLYTTRASRRSALTTPSGMPLLQTAAAGERERGSPIALEDISTVLVTPTTGAAAARLARTAAA